MSFEFIDGQYESGKGFGYEDVRIERGTKGVGARNTCVCGYEK